MIRKAFPKIEKRLRKAFDDEFSAQGHNMTGDGLKSIDMVLTPNSIIGKMEKYMVIQSRGTNPLKIPFRGTSRGRGGGRRSKYIQGLQRFVKKRITSDEKKSLGIAFAIAKTQQKEGMPTVGAFKKSKNGRRLDWIDIALENAEKIITEELEKQGTEDINAIIDKFI